MEDLRVCGIMNGEERQSALLGIPPPHIELLISRLLKQKRLGNNNGLNKQKLPRGIKIPTSMSNNAAISLYSSIVHAEKENDGRNGATNIEGENYRSIKYYASEKSQHVLFLRFQYLICRYYNF